MRRIAWIAVLWIAGCDPTFEPRFKAPDHNVEKDGALHVARMKTPFCCGTLLDDADQQDERKAEKSRECVVGERVPARNLSCDASGCHGEYDTSQNPRSALRALTGADGPSCYACHDQKWDRECTERE